MYDICTVGHITLDKVVTPQQTKFMPGGTSFYFSQAIKSFPIGYLLVTAVGETEQNVLTELAEDGIQIHACPSKYSVYFENIYPENQDHRIQNVLHKADPFLVEGMPTEQATIYHLGPLLSDDFSVDLIKQLAKQGQISLDVQGFLRYVENQKVFYTDWAEKNEALPYITYLKANDFEMEAITGTQDVKKGAQILADYGVKEVIITLGSRGSVILSEGQFYPIPAFKPNAVVDATGCGDTYMAGYLYKRSKGASIEEAGRFGAAMATMNIEAFGPFRGNEASVEALIKNGTQVEVELV